VLSNKIVQDKESVIRFEREAMAAAQLKHPNIARVYYVGATTTTPFLRDGIPRRDFSADVISKRMRVTGGQMLEIITQISGALQEASEKKVLHRDVKPGNVMIENEAGAKLVDFGLAKMAEGDPQLTPPGIAMGTPNYISPEAV
jgi:serine/threonine protein kinase